MIIIPTRTSSVCCMSMLLDRGSVVRRAITHARIESEGGGGEARKATAGTPSRASQREGKPSAEGLAQKAPGTPRSES